MFGLSRLAIQLIASSAIASLVVGSCVVRDRQIAQAERDKIASASKKQGASANAINSQVRERARAPGSFERLLKDPLTCRDCGP